MKKLFLIIGVLIFFVVAGLITVTITKRIFEKETVSLTQGQKDSLTPKDIVNQIVGGGSQDFENLHKVTWAGHNFEVGQLRSADYKSDGMVEWTDNGFIAHDYSMPRSKLLDVNMNQKIKIKVIGNFEGELKSPVPSCASESCFFESSYPFSEFAIYFVDSRDTYEIKYGIALLGTNDRIAAGNVRNKFKFDWFSVENTGREIIFADSSGRKIVTDENSPTEHKLSSLNQDDEWRLRINSHVNGKGYSKLAISEIQIVK